MTFDSRKLVLFLIFVPLAKSSIFDKASRQQCQMITIPLCLDIPYNLTIHPHPLAHGDQQSLHAQTDHFKPLIRTKCNPHIKFFVCSVFAPMCPEQMPQAVTSCRSVCEEVRRDCIGILNEFDIQWPAPLNCSNFPQEPELCMTPPDSMAASYPTPVEFVPAAHPTRPPVVPTELKSVELPSCPSDLINLDPTDKDGGCGFPCDKPIMFTHEEKRTANSWLLAASTASTVVTFLTFLTFLIDRDRFRFPERAIFYVSLCAFVVSLPHLAPVLLDPGKTACDSLPSGRRFLVHDGLDNTTCVLGFLFLYYFSLAGASWWFVVTFAWYLTAARKWVQEELEKRSNYFHVLAWGLPALPTIAILILQKVDASELFGICSVGNLNPWTLMTFVFLPRVLLLFFGCCFIISGFSNMCRERRCFKRRGTDTAKLEKFMFKMGSFSILYVIPSIILCACELYQIFVLLQWFPATIDCKRNGGSAFCHRPQPPKVEVYLIGFVMQLASGVATGLWILSSKTVRSWHRFLFCRQSPDTTKPLAASTTYMPNQQHQVVTQMINGQLVNHYIPLSVMNNGNRPSFGSEQWKPSNAI
ncbi:hypothetical protein M3Y98_00534100 [Aphelenchoides besseyi]|nr:hypothetical protein M3Y98_00534100 [Aphelenchoides besseyi]KAI6208074.1 hypothetical protein M3Y96_00076000 [Aphelenchoides besseyi]